MSTTEHLPVLVYGTLRKGQGNYSHLIKPYAHTVTPVVLTGHRMHGGWGFPYIVTHESGSVVCDLVEFSAEDFQDAVVDLDRLEGYRGDHIGAMNHYDRVRVTVDRDGVPTDAWVYVASANTTRSAVRLPVVEHGDWVRWQSERKDEDFLPTPTGKVSGRYVSAFGPVQED